MSLRSRRKFIQAAALGTAGAIAWGKSRQQPTVATAGEPTRAGAADSSNLRGVLLATSKYGTAPRLDLISLNDGSLLATFEGIAASHAVVPVEDRNRFFVHGTDARTGNGLIWGLQVEPDAGTWTVIYERQLAGGEVLHWQPNRDASLILYNTIGDGALHVLDTHSLELRSYVGGGSHSNMAFFNDDRWLVATDRLGERPILRAIDRATNRVLSETPVGDWSHGVTVNERTGRAFVWANDGVHIVSLAQANLGKHLGVIAASEPGQRSWFCWAPLGGRYSHDQTWNPGDRYSPWLTVLDMEGDRLERIATGDEQPGMVQVSPDGRWAACGSLTSDNLCMFDLEANTWQGSVKIGKGSKEFFDRDLAFSRDRAVVFATNPPEGTVTAVDWQQGRVLSQISLPVTPQFVKVLTV